MDQRPAPAPAIEVPPRVAEVAAAHRLGRPRVSHGEPGPLFILMLGVTLGLASFGILAVVNWTQLPVRAVAVVGLAGLVLSVILVVRAVKVALTGRRICHLYSYGFVYRRNWRLRAVTWPDIKLVTRAYAGRDQKMLDRYHVVLHDGTKLVLFAGTAGEAGQRFVSEVERDIAEHGITTDETLLAAALEHLPNDLPPGRSTPGDRTPDGTDG